MGSSRRSRGAAGRTDSPAMADPPRRRFWIARQASRSENRARATSPTPTTRGFESSIADGGGSNSEGEAHEKRERRGTIDTGDDGGAVRAGESDDDRRAR